MELLDARWDLSSGRTVKFRLVPDDERPYDRHPFAEYVYRRGGRVGTRFGVVFVPVGEETPMFSGNVMLAGGGNPLGAGMWVKFWLDEEADRHPFAGYSARHGQQPGDLFVAAFVEVDDDEQPVDQEARARVERHKRGLSQFAAQLCTSPLFAQYLSERVPVGKESQVLKSKEWWLSDDTIARWMRWTCGVESRADLDRDPEAAERFHRLVRLPFRNWSNTTED